MKPSKYLTCLAAASAIFVFVPRVPAATPEENREFLKGAIAELSDVGGSDLYALQLLSEGKTRAEFMEGRDGDPATVETYEALTPDARKKLAVNFVGKITDVEALEELAEEVGGEVGRKPGGSEEMSTGEARDAVVEALAAMEDVSASNLLFLKGLAEGKTWEDANAGKRTDPDTLSTFESLPADARVKLAMNYAAKIADGASVKKLAAEVVGREAKSGAEDPEGSRKVLIAALQALPDVGHLPPELCAHWLHYLQILAEGKTWEEAQGHRFDDSATISTYEALTPDARKKLAVGFAGKITDPTALGHLAQQYSAMAKKYLTYLSEAGAATTDDDVVPPAAAPAPPAPPVPVP